MPFGDGTGPRGRGRGRGLGMGRGRRNGLSTQGRSAQAAVIAIDAEKCVGCGKCVSVCPTDALSLADGRAKLTQARCKGCRICVSSCPTGAIS